MYIEKNVPDLLNAYIVLPNAKAALPRQFYEFYTVDKNESWKRNNPLYLKVFFAIVTGQIFAIVTDLVFFASMSVRHCDAY